MRGEEAMLDDEGAVMSLSAEEEGLPRRVWLVIDAREDENLSLREDGAVSSLEAERPAVMGAISSREEG